MRRIVPRVLLAGCALALFCVPARAELAVGADAVEVEAADFFNTEPLKLSELKGRLVLLELFSTT